MRDILNETHLEGEYPTIYSTIYDLNEKTIYLYLFHNYEDVKVFDLEEELARGYHVYNMDNLFEETLDYYVFARGERWRQAEIRANYFLVELDPSIYDAYLGTYQGPENLDTLFDYYSVVLSEGELVLKMIPDKAWMRLEPTSETEFFHLSYFDYFEITFLPEENGEVNRFVLNNFEGNFEFERIYIEEEAGEGVQELSFWASLWEKISRFSGTKTFTFLAINLGLILLQTVLQYLKSILV